MLMLKRQQKQLADQDKKLKYIAEMEVRKAKLKEIRNRTSVEELELKYMVKNNRLGPEPVLFGDRNIAWMSFLAQMEEGDELWEFRTCQFSWENLAGRAGIQIIRNGEIIGTKITSMN
jgi:hypothetical protein